MKPLPIRRRGIALMALGFVFIGLGVSRPNRSHAFELIGVCFVIAGAASLKRFARKS